MCVLHHLGSSSFYPSLIWDQQKKKKKHDEQQEEQRGAQGSRRPSSIAVCAYKWSMRRGARPFCLDSFEPSRCFDAPLRGWHEIHTKFTPLLNTDLVSSCRMSSSFLLQVFSCLVLSSVLGVCRGFRCACVDLASAILISRKEAVSIEARIGRTFPSGPLDLEVLEVACSP